MKWKTATSVSAAKCDCGCGHTFVYLFDEKDEPFARFSLDLEEDWAAFVQNVINVSRGVPEGTRLQ